MTNPTLIEARFIDANDPEGRSFYWDTFTSLPFKEGDEITIKIVNNDPKFWDVDDFSQKYKIEKVEFDIKTVYPKTQTVSQVKRELIANIYVIEQ